jgi:hypothetical protein
VEALDGQKTLPELVELWHTGRTDDTVVVILGGDVPMSLRFRVGTFFLAILMSVGLTAPANATISTGPFTSYYYFDTNLYGQTQFTVTQGNYVYYTGEGTQGATSSYRIALQRYQSLRWETVAYCDRTHSIGGRVGCTFYTAYPQRSHRLSFHKANNGVWIRGNVSVS